QLGDYVFRDSVGKVLLLSVVIQILNRHDPNAAVLSFASRLELALAQPAKARTVGKLQDSASFMNLPGIMPDCRAEADGVTPSMDRRASISRISAAASCRSSSDINLKLASSLKWGISARTACFSFKFSWRSITR